MYTKVSQVDLEIETILSKISSLSEAAETIRNQALDLARAKLSSRQQDLSLGELLGRRDFVDYFRYTLAQETAQVIAAYDQNVEAFYLFEESANPDAETEDFLPTEDVTIHLLALVTSKSAASDAFITSLDSALTEAVNGLPSTAFAERTSILNVIPVTGEDVENRRGYAALLSSVFGPPLKIWPRE